MIVKIDFGALPAAAESRLYLDYISGIDTAVGFFTHPPLDFSAALGARRGHRYPRQEIVQRLVRYNAGLSAHPNALANVEALSDPSTFCVISGQQAGFLGGPMYAAYKIITTIRLAVVLEANFGVRVVPVFWLATEDHDFDEINHAYVFKRDGEVGRVRFEWRQAGCPIADLPVGVDVRRAYEGYFESLSPGPYFAPVKGQFAPRSGEDYSTWHARIWSQLFSERGLVIVEPRVLRPPARDFFQFALKQSDEIRRRLDEVSQQLRAAGYTPALTSAQAGQLYTFDPAGRRVRVQNPQAHLAEAATHPERYSADAALRPLLADAMLPVVVGVLGPGEIAYQAMLKPLYDLFELPQPLLFPRKSYTIVARDEAERIARYRTSVTAILTEQLDVDAAFRSLVPSSELEVFASARRRLEAALAPLRPYLEGIDPNLGKTWAQTLANATRGLDKLEERAMKARMSRSGFSKKDVQALRNALLPRGRLQERIFPLPHFMNRHGTGLIDELFSAGELDDFSHHILTLEEEHASSQTPVFSEKAGV